MALHTAGEELRSTLWGIMTYSILCQDSLLWDSRNRSRKGGSAGVFSKLPLLCWLWLATLNPTAPHSGFPHSLKVMSSFLEASKMPNQLVVCSYSEYRWRYLGGNKALPQKVAKLLFPETIQ